MQEETELISLVIHTLLKIIFDIHRIRRTNASRQTSAPQPSRLAISDDLIFGPLI
jgi:hypothetical protein